jgi:ABC-type xylose transport system permease subunit
MKKWYMSNTKMGLLVGGVVGFVTGLAVAIEGYSTMENLEFIGWVVGLLITGPIGLVIGALIGAFVGWVLGRVPFSGDQRVSPPDWK